MLKDNTNQFEYFTELYTETIVRTLYIEEESTTTGTKRSSYVFLYTFFSIWADTFSGAIYLIYKFYSIAITVTIKQTQDGTAYTEVDTSDSFSSTKKHASYKVVIRESNFFLKYVFPKHNKDPPVVYL